MKPRLMAAALVALLTWVGMASAAVPDWAGIKAQGTLRVIHTWPNSNYFARDDDRQGPGLERELLESFARLHGIKLQVIEVPGYDDLIPALLEGRGDIIVGNITVTPKRAKAIAFTAEILPTRSVVLTRRPHRVVHTIEELRQERVATIAGSSMAEAVAAAGVPPGSIDTSTGRQSPSGLIGSRGITAAVEEVAAAVSQARGSPDLQIGMFVGPPGSTGWGVRKTDTVLLATINEYLGNVRKTDTWARLVVKYFGQDTLDILRRARGDDEKMR